MSCLGHWIPQTLFYQNDDGETLPKKLNPVMLWVLTRVWNMSLGMLCALCNIHNMEGYECEMCPGITQLVLGNLNGAMGRLGKKSQQYIGSVLWASSSQNSIFWVSFRGKGTCWVAIYGLKMEKKVVHKFFGISKYIYNLCVKKLPR